MPPRKELHYFDRNFPKPNHLAEPSVLRRIFGRADHHRAWRQKLRRDLRRSLRTRDLEALRWFGRFYFGSCDDPWYGSLFPRDASRVTGEITPAYSILADNDVAHISRLLPHLKVILLLRDPVQRAWSQVRYDWTRGARADIGDLEEIKAFLDSPSQTLRSNYPRMIDTWERHIPAERMFIGFYDDVVSQPAALLERVSRFLGIDPAKSPATDLSRKVHVSREASIPAELRRFLCQKYLPDLRLLSERFGGSATEWLRAAEAIG